MANAPSPFFTASQNAADALTRLYDFVWPSAVALWNLRWQVGGYKKARPDCSHEELAARFVAGSGIHGANLEKACLQHTWGEQQAVLALFVLVNAFAIHESWAEAIVEELNVAQVRETSNGLKFPSAVHQGAAVGVGAAVSHLLQTRSPAMEAEVRPVLRQRSKVHPSHVEEMLTVYRFFKECRNALMHCGGKATANVMAAERAVVGLSAASLPFTIPRFSSPSLGAPIALDLYGVVGFSDVIRRIIITLDAELSASSEAERILRDRWKSKFGRVQVKADKSQHHAVLVRKLMILGLPRVPKTLALAAALKKAGLIF